MAGAMASKLWEMIGMGPVENRDEEDYEEDYELDEVEDEEEADRRLWGRRNSKVVNMAAQQKVRMVILQPTNFEQAVDICDLLKEKRSVVINLEYVNKDVARRIIDVISGAARVLDGHMQKISSSIFLVAPFNYEIATENAREEIKNKLSVSWLKNNNSID